MVSSTPWSYFTPGKDPVPILQEAGWAPGPVWTGGNSCSHRNSIPDHPARSSVAIPTELRGPYLTVYKEIIDVSSHIHIKPISTFCDQNVGFLNVKPSGIYSDHFDLKG